MQQQLLKNNSFTSLCCKYFIIFMLLFRPVNYLVVSFETYNKAFYYIAYLLFIINYILIPFVIYAIIYSKSLKIDSVFFVIFLILSISCTVLFFPQNSIFLEQLIFSFIYIILAYCVVRNDLIDLKELENKIIKVARILFFALFIVLASVLKFNVNEEYMNYSDANSIVSAILLYSAIVKGNKHDYITGFASFLLILLYGSRGSFLSLCLLILLFLLFKKNSIRKQILLYVLFLIILVLILFWNDILYYMRGVLDKFDINSRTIASMFSDSFFSSLSRKAIYQYLFELIKENALLGIGLCGDRYYMPFVFRSNNIEYAHNLFIEIVLDYGLILGSIIIIYILKQIFSGFFFNKKIDYEDKCFIAILFAISFVQLLVSRSYLSEISFFILLAYSTSFREGNQKKPDDKYMNLRYSN